MASDDAFVGLGGFGVTGGGEAMDARVRSLRVAREQPSILADVVKRARRIAARCAARRPTSS